MSTLTIAAAQSISIAGDLAANIQRHLRFIEVAAEQGVELLVFPELSLTGYENEVAAALAIDPQLPRAWLEGKDTAPELPPISWKNKAFASLANMARVKFQLRKLSQRKQPDPGVSPLRALIEQQLGNALRTRQYRRWIAKRSA